MFRGGKVIDSRGTGITSGLMDRPSLQSGGTPTGGEGGGGSGGQNAPSINGPTNASPGGNYGGGGAMGHLISDVVSTGRYGGDGGQGAVRIIWGTGRSFPNTLTGDNSTPAPA